jgi:hypothetical protein
VSAWAKRPATGAPSFSPEPSIWRDTRNTRTSWPSSSGFPCRVQQTCGRGMLIYPN